MQDMWKDNTKGYFKETWCMAIEWIYVAKIKTCCWFI